MRDHCCWGIHSLKVAASILTSIVTVIVATTVMRLLFRDCLNSILSALQCCPSSPSSSRHALFFSTCAPCFYHFFSSIIASLPLTSFPSSSLSLLLLLPISHKPTSHYISYFPLFPPIFPFRVVSDLPSFLTLKADGNRIFPRGLQEIETLLIAAGKILAGQKIFLISFHFTLFRPLFYFDGEADTQSSLHAESWNFLELKYLHFQLAVF